jgi:tetratricopeptide (TPR) repeat protein
MATTQEPDFAAAHLNPVLMEAALALHDNRLSDAEPLLKNHLKHDPFDVAAIRMLAELAGRIGRIDDAEKLLRRAVELAPGFVAARSNLALVLYRNGDAQAALDQLALLPTSADETLRNANLKAAVLGQVGEFDEAIALYERVISEGRPHPKVWMSYGHVLKTVGRQDDAVSAYRAALARQPDLGEVWWSLANLKTVKFSDDDVTAMETALASENLAHEDQFHLHFALGKAHDDRGEYEKAFGQYAQGNLRRSKELSHDAGAFSKRVNTGIAQLTSGFFDERSGQGCQAADPIFILGMPRAGSTLIEQILASHSQVEGTMELPDIPAIVSEVAGDGSWHKALASLSGANLAQLGQSYLDRTRIQRKTGKPFFIDKLPNNWLYTGFIQMILPNARIIDARRDAMDCCFSNFRQHFARGQAFSYGLTDMGQYYADYVRFMDHIDAVLPGRVIRVQHEDLLDNPEGGIRMLLDQLGLPFEPGCLEFHKSDRAVRTASSEQVRRPINRDGAGQWKPYEAWLGPLKDALIGGHSI